MQGVPARGGILEYPQPDGSMLQITLHGDEYSCWYESADGYVLLPAADGTLEYATLRSGALVTTGIRALNADKRPASQLQMLNSLPKQQMLEVAKNQAVQQGALARAPRRAADSGLINNYPKTGSPKAMVLLVEFEDVKFTTPNANESFQQLATQPGYNYAGATGSTLDYFKAQSGGLFTPDFQVFGPIEVPHTEAYYGDKNGMAYDTQPWKMVQDACKKLHETNPELDWSEFDNDGDGFVDSIFIFYAGYGQNEGAPSWTIWPHSANLYTLYNINLEFNGVKIGNYACTNELQGTSGMVRCGIGTFVHEYSHVLGLPDLYPTNGSGAFSPRDFEVMDHGSYNNQGNTPPNYSVFERYSVGWINPRKLSAAEDITLHPITSGEALLIPCEHEKEYYLLENRQKQGWDAYIPGHGLLIWHIDFDLPTWINNKVNNDTGHQRVDLIEADNVRTEDTRSGDPFPGSGNVRKFTSESTPAMTTWTGYDPQMPLTDIHEADGIITFKVKDGGESLAPVAALDADEITPVSFRANWEKGVGVYQYEVDICRDGSLVPFVTLTVKDAQQVTVTGLDPLTNYSYVVRAVSGDRHSVDSNRIHLTTLPPSFEQRIVEALEADEITHESFLARWNALDDARGYELTVQQKTPVDPTYVNVDFTKDAAGKLLPDGWSTTSTTTGSLSGYCGQAAPSLRLTQSGDRLTTPTFTDDINSFSFWYRANSTGDDAAIVIEGLTDGKWSLITQIQPLQKATGTTVTISADSETPMPHGTKAIRITFLKEGNGSVYVDDINMGYGARYDAISLPGYDAADQGNALSARISALQPNSTYYYTVRAYNDAPLYSVVSPEIKVVTNVAGAVSSLQGNGWSVTAKAGYAAINAPAGTHVVIYDAAGCTEAEAIVPASGAVNIPLSKGIHLIAPFGCKIQL